MIETEGEDTQEIQPNSLLLMGQEAKELVKHSCEIVSTRHVLRPRLVKQELVNLGSDIPCTDS